MKFPTLNQMGDSQPRISEHFFMNHNFSELTIECGIQATTYNLDQDSCWVFFSLALHQYYQLSVFAGTVRPQFKKLVTRFCYSWTDTCPWSTCHMLIIPILFFFLNLTSKPLCTDDSSNTHVFRTENAEFPYLGGSDIVGFEVWITLQSQTKVLNTENWIISVSIVQLVPKTGLHHALFRSKYFFESMKYTQFWANRNVNKLSFNYIIKIQQLCIDIPYKTAWFSWNFSSSMKTHIYKMLSDYFSLRGEK